MAVTAHPFPKYQLNHLRWKSTAQNVSPFPADLSADTLKVALITAGTYTWNATAQGHEFLSDFLGGSGGGALTEVSTSGTGYSRQNLTSVTFTAATNVDTLTCANPNWPTSTFTATYAVFYDETASNATDATRPIIGYWDLGGTTGVAAGTYTLTISGSGLVTWTHN